MIENIVHRGGSVIKTRDFYFDTLKGFLIICVIIGNSLEHANPTSIDPHYFLLVLYMFHMPLFAFVSGYFCKKSRRTTTEKVIEIFKLYIGVQIFYFFFERFIGNSYVRLEFLSPKWTMWYLLSLIFWYVISDYIKNKKKWFIASIIIALLIGMDRSVGVYISTSRTFFFLPFFIAGLAFNKESYLVKIRKHKFKLVALSAIILSILYLLADSTPLELLFEYSTYTEYFDRIYFPLFIRGLHYLGAFIIGATIMAFVPEKKTPISIIGENSLIMYVTHGAVVKYLYKQPWVRYNTPLNVFLSEVVILGTVIAITLTYSHLKKKRKTKTSE